MRPLPTADEFARAYARLNERQREAVDSIEGPVMVIAGPGTGKTSILTLRIANILRRTDTPANGILALTFTESGAHSMRQKLFSYIGQGAYRVHIHTFHGFAEEIIEKYPEYFPRIIGGAIAGDSERLAILEDELLRGDYDLIRPFGKPEHYVRKAIGAIQDLKRDGVSPDQFLALLDAEEKAILADPGLLHATGRFKGSVKKEHADALRNNKRNRELASLYKGYEAALSSMRLYDYDDMLGELVRALKEHQELLRSLQEEYLYVLADEHQDANNSQNAVLELLSDYRDTRNLFIVGDEKQAIYRFQGASLENFLYFRKKYPEAKVIYLGDNYRSSQRILDASHALIGPAPGGGIERPRLAAAGASAGGPPIRFVAYESADEELEGLAADVGRVIEGGVSAEDIAILVRTNAEISLVGAALQGCSVPYSLFTDDDVLADIDISKLILLLRAVVSPEDDRLLGSAFFIDFLKMHPVDALMLNRAAREKRSTPLELLSKPELRPELIDRPALDSFSRNFSRWMVKARNAGALDLFLSIVEETGFQQHLLGSKDSLEKTEKLSRLYDEIKMFLVRKKDATLKDFMSSLDTLERHGSSISFSRRTLGARGVSVLTAHKAKGLEWAHVFIPNVVEGAWGDRRGHGGFRLPPPLRSPSADGAEDDDEKRLFYVAMTRAKDTVHLSAARIDRSGRERLPSRFVEEIPPELLSRETGARTSSGERMSRAFKKHASRERTIFDPRYLREIFLDQGLDVTALNNYIECPYKYFFRNLVRLPDVPGKHLHFGTAVHAALRAFAEARREKKAFSENDLLGAFTADLARKPIQKAEYTDALKRGREVLPAYFKARSPSWHDDALVEHAVKGVFIPLPGGEQLRLRGRIDKIELFPGGVANVVDYKTGSRKTRNEILGLTKTSDGAIKRQLDFYRLLLELEDDGAIEAVSADVDFVEPDDKGVIRPPERFELSKEDSDRVREETVRVATEILQFSFEGRGCGEADCEFCPLAKLLV